MCKNSLHTDTSPEILWERFIDGDMSSFRCLYTEYYQNLFSFGLKYLSSDETEDTIQNLFLYILQSRESLSKVQSVKAYLFISFRNQILKQRKAKKLAFLHVDLESVIDQQISYTKESKIKELFTFLKILSPKEHEIIQLKYFQKYKNQEIATSLNIKCQTVRNILSNAIKKLKKTSLQTSY